MTASNTVCANAFAAGLIEGRDVHGSAVQCRFEHQGEADERSAWFEGFLAGRREITALMGEPD